MIVVKGEAVQSLPSTLTFRQRITAFLKYQSTQAMAFFGAVAIAWQTVPDDIKTEVFGTFYPMLHRIGALAFVIGAVVTVYKTRMNTQVVTVPPVPDPATATPVPPPLVLVPAVAAPTPLEPSVAPATAPVTP